MIRESRGNYHWIGVRIRSFQQQDIQERYEKYVKYIIGSFIQDFYYPVVTVNTYEHKVIPFVLFVKTLPIMELLWEWRLMDNRIYYFYMAPGNNKIALIPNSEIVELQESIKTDGNRLFKHLSEVRRGDKVRIIAGCISGATGIVDRIDKNKNLCYFQVTSGSEFMNYTQIPLNLVELVDG